MTGVFTSEPTELYRIEQWATPPSEEDDKNDGCEDPTVITSPAAAKPASIISDYLA